MAGKITEEFYISGHKNTLSAHRSTLEFTKEDHLTHNGDCILGVSATKSIRDFDTKFIDALKNDNAKVSITIESSHIKETVNASGSRNLILSHPEDMVIRKSSFICERTLAINADKSAQDIKRDLVDILKDRSKKAKVTISVLS